MLVDVNTVNASCAWQGVQGRGHAWEGDDTGSTFGGHYGTDGGDGEEVKWEAVGMIYI